MWNYKSCEITNPLNCEKMREEKKVAYNKKKVNTPFFFKENCENTKANNTKLWNQFFGIKNNWNDQDVKLQNCKNS